jgi:flagellar hook-length control protein FliK
MIRADVANRLQPAADLSLRPALPAQEITDKLAGLVAGQRLLAEIQSLMPNGTYRALINQRSVTLALPFAARTGDAIELEVAESDGKLTLAVVAKAASGGGEGDGDSAATSLSRTGVLISHLLGGARDARSGPVALPLNGNQPIAASPPDKAQDLLPLLRQAISESGMFYESHQAEWVEGRINKAQLLQEPQGKLTPLTPPLQDSPGASESVRSGRAATADAGPLPTRSPDSTAITSQAAPSAQSTPTVAPQALALVQQQLEAFATQNFAWHGQVWPGQQMNWEIEHENARGDRDGSDGRNEGGSDGEKWQTRLRLTLPHLGEVDARLHIQGRQISLSVVAGDVETRALLRSDAATLRGQLEQAGLDLASLGISAPPEVQALPEPA